jgi:hypothetical protein
MKQLLEQIAEGQCEIEALADKKKNKLRGP